MYEELKQMIKESKNIVFFGGAGVSTESNIPDFRSENGIYKEKKYPYQAEIMLSHNFYLTHTKEFYDFYFNEMIYENALPNEAHLALARLEKQGKLKAVVTQNIDGLHQLSGSNKVYELHGSVHRNYCTRCHKFYDLHDMLKQKENIPVCDCGGIIKPDVVLYGEGLNDSTVNGAIEAISKADMLIVGGTSLVVYPAAGLLQYFRGKYLVLINRDKTDMDHLANICIHESIGKVLKEVVE